MPALIAVPLLVPFLQRLLAPLRTVLAFAPAALTVAAGSFLGGHTVSPAVALMLFVAAVAVAAPAVVETVDTAAPCTWRDGRPLHGCSTSTGAGPGPQPTGALTGIGFGGTCSSSP
ncbi:hypothetical protein KYY02_02545 [Streptomyces pimonensis]|uniref:Uncharacterized protein n=1 Tax=Streptomyces pimonensis TaxID=2860288 RepID=A0ABV4ISH6_9ACTN